MSQVLSCRTVELICYFFKRKNKRANFYVKEVNFKMSAFILKIKEENLLVK
jgi:hypothetical protein